MENNKINIAELLKDCPQGMELDCTMYEGVVTFVKIDEYSNYPIVISVQHNGDITIYQLTQTGQPCISSYTKCVIFPKGKTTWEGFVPPCNFKDGDIVTYKYETALVSMILNKFVNFVEVHYYCALYDNAKGFITNNYIVGEPKYVRLATEEEKQKLFQAIKEKGYRWNAETKTLEKLIEPKFKVGDKVKRKDVNYIHIVTIADIDQKYYGCVGKNKQYLTICIESQDEWELVSDEIKPKFKVGDTVRHKENKIHRIITKIHQDCYECDNRYALTFNKQDNYELVPNKFDIYTLVPFESRVLVRDSEYQYWQPAIWGIYNNSSKTYPYVTVGGNIYRCLIPYKGNEHLLGKSDDCSNYYKTWEE